MSNFIIGNRARLDGQSSDPENSLNFNINDSFIYSVEVEKVSDEGLIIDGNFLHIYIGKMFIKRENIYSKEFVIGLLGYVLRKLKPGTKFTVQICRCVSEILNGQDDIEGTRSFEDQKRYIYKLARSVYKVGEDKLEIIDIESRHPELFSRLRDIFGEKGIGIDGILDEKTIPVLDINNFNSLHIAQYLYWVMSVNNHFAERIKGTKPSQLKSESGNSDYYGMLEISIRISDFLKGITVQGGERRQNVYDNIIRDILYGKIGKKYSELIGLQNFCRQVEPERKFSTIHLDTKKYNEIQKEKSYIGKLRKIIIAASISLSLLIGYSYYDQWNTQKHLDAAIEEILKKYNHLSFRPIWENNESKDYSFLTTVIDKNMDTSNFKLRYFKGIVEYSIMEYFKDNYNIGNFDEKELGFLILNEMVRKEYVGKLYKKIFISNSKNIETEGYYIIKIDNYYTYIKKSFIKNFIENIFIKENNLRLVRKGVSKKN